MYEKQVQGVIFKVWSILY